jgi:SSS family solute:Na+ symporter
MRPFDLVVLVCYLAGVVALGVWVGRRRSTADEFMAAGRRIPAWAVGLSIFATYVSSISFIALPGNAFSKDWGGFLFALSIPPAAWLAARYFVPFYRRSGELSCYEHLERRFGPWARVYAVACYLLTQAFRTGAILYLLALALAPLTGFSLPTLILIAGVAVLVYTLAGGMEAVIWTEVMQSAVFVVGAAACVAVIFAGMPEGPGQMFRIASEHNKFALGDWSANLADRTAWVVLLYGLAINLRNFGVDQSYVQRYHAARSERDAVASVWVGAIGYIPTAAVFFFIGTGLFAFYAANPDRGLDPASEIAANRGDRVFPHFMVTELPVGMAGLVLAAVFAAAQSTVSGSVVSSATLIFNDVYKRYFHPAAGDREAIRVLRWSTLVFGVTGTAAAVLMWRLNVDQSALDAWWRLEGVGTGGVLGLFLLGQIVRRTNRPAAVVATISGILIIAWVTLFPGYDPETDPLRSPWHPLLATALGTINIVLVGGLLTMIFGASRRTGS